MICITEHPEVFKKLLHVQISPVQISMRKSHLQTPGVKLEP